MKFDKLRKKLGMINPDTLGDVLEGKIILTAEEQKEFDLFMAKGRQMFAPTDEPDEYYDGEICCRSGVSKVDGTMILTFEVEQTHTFKKKRISVDMKAMQFLEWFGTEDIDNLKQGIKQYVDSP